MADERKLAIKMLLEDKEALSKLRKSLGTVESANKNAASAIIPTWVKVTAAIGAATFAAVQFAKTTVNFGKKIVETGAKFERLEVELMAFVGTASEAKEIMKDLTEFAASTPFQLGDLAQAQKRLLVVKDRVDDMSLALRAAGNIAAATGLTIQQAADNLARTYSAGAGSAQLFFERGVRDMASKANDGMNLLTVSTKEAGDAIVKTFTTGSLGDSMLRLSRTFDGLMSTLRDNIELVFKDIADAGFFESVKVDLATVLKMLTQMRGEGASYDDVVKGLSDSMINLKDKVFDVAMAISGGIGSALDTFRGFSKLVKEAELKSLQFQQTLAKFDPRRFFKNEQARELNEAYQERQLLIMRLTKQIEELNEKQLEGFSASKMIDDFRKSFQETREVVRQEMEAAKQEDAAIESQATEEKLEEEVNKYLEAERKKIEAKREMWALFREEDTAAELAKMQQESEFFDFAMDTQRKSQESMWTLAAKQRDTFQGGISGMFKQMVRGTLNAEEAFKNLGLSMLDVLIDYATQLAVNAILSKTLMATQAAAAAATGAATAAAWAPAAANVSLATFGANASGATTALSSVHALAQGLSVPRAEQGADILSRGTVLVGEAGPEFLDLPAGARVRPLDHPVSGGGARAEFHFHGDVLDLGDFKDRFEDIIGPMASEFIAREKDDR